MTYKSIFGSIIVVLLGLMTAPLWAADATLKSDANTVLITGANRGIGLEFVRQYAASGWNVIATCRAPERAEELRQVAAANDAIVIEQLDVLDHAGIDALADKYAKQPIDVLLNNAGLMRGPDRGQMVGTVDYDEFDLFYRVNAMGPLKVAEAFYPNVKASEFKLMAALTTGQGDKGIPFPGFTLYKTSKAALDALQREMALRWKKQGIVVITLLPGRVLTHGEADNGQQNAIPIADSIAGMITVLENATPEQSGRVIQWDGAVLDQ